MNQSNSSKQVLLSVIGVAILVVAVVGVSFAFFNYTRTGNQNTLRTGQISFTTSQSTMEIDNVFPVAANPDANDPNVVTSTVTITGDTTYSGGLEYRVTAQNVDFTVGTGSNAKNVPVRIDMSATGNLGNVNDGARTNTNVTELKLHPVSGQTSITSGYLLADGHIAPPAQNSQYAANRVSGTITIKAYLDASQVAITDTLQGEAYAGPGTETGYTDNTANGTTSAWVNNRTRLTTTEWNSFASEPLKFNITVEAVEGTAFDTPYIPPVTPQP